MKSKLTRANIVVMALAVLMAGFAPAAQAAKCSTETAAAKSMGSLTSER